MKALVTGGNGFIGRVLCRELLEANYELVHIVDDLSNSNRDAGLVTLLEDRRVRFTAMAVNDFEPLERYTHIFHLASPVGPAGVLNYAGRMGPLIVHDTAKMAHYAIAMGAKLLDVSTSEVYGKDPGAGSQAEDIDKVVPSKYTVRLEYGVAKLACEVSLSNLALTTDLVINIVRPFNIVGVGQKGEVGFVLPRFVQQALSCEPLTVFGDGEQKRCFTSVHDIVDAIMRITNSGVRGKIYNIGNPDNICTINDLAHTVRATAGSNSPTVHVDPKTVYGRFYEEAWNKIPDITKIQCEIGWRPSRALQDIVLEVVDVEMGGTDMSVLRQVQDFPRSIGEQIEQKRPDSVSLLAGPGPGTIRQECCQHGVQWWIRIGCGQFWACSACLLRFLRTGPTGPMG
jgi:nucleoside-diphosphate-sugar epimerase